MAKKRTAANEGTASSVSKRRRTSESEDVAVTPKVTRQSKRKSKRSITSDAPTIQDISSKPTASEPTVQQSKHVKFDDEESGGDDNAPPATAENDEPIEDEEAAAEEDSEDDAPEAISTSAAQKGTKASLASVAKAVSRQRTDEKRKRKDRDARLKSQADAAKRAKPDKVMETEDQEADSGADSDTAPPVALERDIIGGTVETESESSLDLLPAYLLQEDFTRQPSPSPPPQSGAKDHQDSRKAVASQRKLLIRDLSSVPREKQVGPVNVAVLEKTNAFLTPKADGKGRKLREGWLKGRLGRGGKVLIERGAVNRGFIRH